MSNLANFSFNVQLGVFDQCSYDVRLFVGIVAGVGGAIIAATVIYAIVSLALIIKESKDEHAKGGTNEDL
jgi:hypothetical protein